MNNRVVAEMLIGVGMEGLVARLRSIHQGWAAHFLIRMFDNSEPV